MCFCYSLYHITVLNAYDTITTPDVNLSSYYMYLIELCMYSHYKNKTKYKSSIQNKIM